MYNDTMETVEFHKQISMYGETQLLYYSSNEY